MHYFSYSDIFIKFCQDFSYKEKVNKKVNRKVQEEPQAEVAANPWHQEEEKKWHRLTCA